MSNGYHEQQPLTDDAIWGVGIRDNSNKPRPHEVDTTALDVMALRAKERGEFGQPGEGRR